MSRIDELIRRLCPDGVPHRSLGDVGVFVRGNGLQKKDLTGAGVPAIHYGQVHTHYGVWATETISYVTPEFAKRLRKAQPGDLVIATTSEDDEAVGKAVAWLGAQPAAVGGDAYVYQHTLDPKYVAYFFQSERLQEQKRRAITGTKVRRISGDGLAKIWIPVPPLEVQREIVRVLDLFTTLEAELATELEAELEARRRQYAHYRDSLYGLPEGEVRWIPMGEVGEFTRGRRFTKADVVDRGIPSIHYGEIYTCYGVAATETVSHVRRGLGEQLRYAKPGDVVVAAVGETVEDVGKAVAWLGDTDAAIHDDCFGYRHAMDPKYVSYYMQTDAFHSQKNKHVARAKVKRLSAQGLEKITIPVLPLEEQARIVAILDNFDALVNDLSIGLPAELAARRTQYEYYRDRLLIFKEAAA